MMSVKIVIPARFGSSRLPAKPLLLINEKPIFWHVVQRILEAGVSLDNIILATDHESIEIKANNLGIPVVMTSTDHASGTDRVFEVAKKLGWEMETIIINVQGDEPLVPPHLIRKLIDFTVKEQKFNITTVVTPICNTQEFVNPNVVKAILGECNQALYFTRSPSPYDRDNPSNFNLAKRHIGIYGYKLRSLERFCHFSEASVENCERLEQLRALANGLIIGAIEIDSAAPHGIDTMADYLAIKNIMEL